MLRILVLVLATALASFAQKDGPAVLPIALPSTVATSPNAPKHVLAGTNLQTAINSAVCGDVLQLDHTGTWMGTFTANFPSCDTGHWVTIMSDAPVLVNPVTGRVVPGQQLPKLVMVADNDRLNYGSLLNVFGIEVTREQGSGAVYDLIQAVPGAHDFIFNTVYVHGNAQDETDRGFMLANSLRGVIENSWISEMHCRALSGACGDSQCIAGGITTVAPDEGVFLINNNECQASGENIIFGGGAANVVPHDITVTNNHFWKNPCWNPTDPCYAPTAGANGVPEAWIVKNCFELKNAQRVLYDSNICENVWGGFTQVGFAVLLTTKNPGGGAPCPVCLVADVTIRNSRFYNTAGAIQIGFGASDNGTYGAGAYDYSIHDLVFDRLNDPALYQAAAWMIQISSGLSPTGQVLHDVTIQHVTLDVPKWHGKNSSASGGGHGFLTLGGPLAPTMYNIHFDYNVLPGGNDPILSTGGGPSNCAYTVQQQGAPIIPTCWTGNSSFTGNVVLNNQVKPYPYMTGTDVTNAGANPDVLP